MQTTGIIYLAKNIVSGKCYVGQTIKTLEQRKREHLVTTIKADYKFARALQKYPQDSWEWSTLAEVNISDLNEWEVFFIKDLDSFKNGYNTHPGGNWLGEANPRHNSTIYELWHPEHGLIKESLPELLLRSDSFGKVCELLKGTRHHINEFVLLKNKDRYNEIVKIHSFYHPEHGVITCTSKELYDNFRSHFSKTENRIHTLTSGRVQLHFGWCLAKNKDNYNDLIDRTPKITLTHKEHGTLTLKRSEFKQQFGLTDSGMTYLLNGRNKSSLGWTLPSKAGCFDISTYQDFERIEDDGFLNKLTNGSFKEYCLKYINNTEERDYIADRYPIIAEAYIKLGAERMKSLSYNNKRFLSELQITSDKSQMYIKKKLSENLQLNVDYTVADIKNILNNVYKQIGINKKVTANDIQEYCNVNFKNKKINGKSTRLVEYLGHK